jgi:hypothetical protein
VTPLEMNPEIRARWTAALRSGDYSQGRDTLRRDDLFCCLGVLCDLAVKDGAVTGKPHGDGRWAYSGTATVLPRAVQEWAALETCDPLIAVPGRVPASLTELNDDENWTFARIADAIDGGEAS